MRRVFDCFPFFNELDVLEIRLHELNPVVDWFMVVESKQTYGGDPKPYRLTEALEQDPARWEKFRDKIRILQLPWLEPDIPARKPKGLDMRAAGRAREEFQRNALINLMGVHRPVAEDVIIFSDCDEIPSCFGVCSVMDVLESKGIHRFKQRSYYYNVNCLIDYGRDICSRARIGTYAQLEAVGGFFNFRMHKRNDPSLPAVSEGGWHFSYFGGDVDRIKEKVSALHPFLAEYKLFGDDALIQDIIDRKDLHHRHTKFTELPENFTYCASDDPNLPHYYLRNRDRFKHFTIEDFISKYRGKQ
jgi:beta-1,4-mannosyl-glycoprotein beta-1,4-N-acetylglucosaminyltransferase